MRQYKGEQILGKPEQKETLEKISKVHFVIHPGFTHLTEVYKDLVIKDKKFGNLSAPELELIKGIKTEPKKPTPKELKDIYINFLKRTIDYASQAKDNELVIAFLFGNRDVIKKHLNDQAFGIYAEQINNLKKKLGKRLIIISDPSEYSNNEFISVADAGLSNPGYMNKITNGIKKITAARGFDISPEAISQAYGEELLACVANGGANLNKNLGLKKRTVVLPEASDYGRPGMANDQLYDFVAEKTEFGQFSSFQIPGTKQPLHLNKHLKHVRFKKPPE